MDYVDFKFNVHNAKYFDGSIVEIIVLKALRITAKYMSKFKYQ